MLMGNVFFGKGEGGGGGEEKFIKGRSPSALLEEMGQAHFNE